MLILVCFHLCLFFLINFVHVFFSKTITLKQLRKPTRRTTRSSSFGLQWWVALRARTSEPTSSWTTGWWSSSPSSTTPTPSSRTWRRRSSPRPASSSSRWALAAPTPFVAANCFVCLKQLLCYLTWELKWKGGGGNCWVDTMWHINIT